MMTAACFCLKQAKATIASKTSPNASPKEFSLKKANMPFHTTPEKAYKKNFIFFQLK
jgi:hypothetical protein